MTKNIAIKIYNVIFIILLPLLFLRLLLKSLKLKTYRLRWKERLGIFSPPQLNNSIWVHAVSVGEIMAAMPIIQKIQIILPNNNIVVTCTTPAGSYILQKKLSKKVFHVYFPFDVNFAINNFLSKIKPKLLIILEKEIWPNLIVNCHKNNIPIIIANAQLSNKSFYRYSLIKSLMASWLKNITFICTQTKFDTYKFKRLINNNAIKNIITVGNTKFDLITQTEKLASDILRPTWIAASTHPREEELILEAHHAILNKIPNALLILVPRHSERCFGITKKIKEIKFVMRSKQNNLDIPNGQIYLVDSVGELNLLYSMSQVAFVGGSLVPIGGHNVLEPAALSIPVIVGPYTANCKQIVFRMKMANGLFVIKNPQELSEIVLQLLTNKNLCEKIGLNAKKFLDSHVGASEQIVDLVARVVSSY
ncbi:MAG: 3-deoxy-D-manno-octulosonic acid transferase [Gammaproteobacteria bacterium]